MIEFSQGNLLEANTEALVNAVNTVGVMGKGIALQFKQIFPENFRQYKIACDVQQIQPGRMFVVAIDRELPKYIINFPTKRHWKGKTKIEYIKIGLKALVEEILKLDINSIAIPSLGCGNGGLNWTQVKPIIIETFLELPHVRAIVFEPIDARCE